MMKMKLLVSNDYRLNINLWIKFHIYIIIFQDIQSEYEKNILSDEWSKDDNHDNEEEQVILYLFGRTGREKDEWLETLFCFIIYLFH